MNIARLFSYTRLLERQLIRERRRYEKERADERALWEVERQRFESERQRLENVVFLGHGFNAPHPHAMRSETNGGPRKTIPRAVGPIGTSGLAARNAELSQEIAAEKDEEVRRAPQLDEEDRERIRKAAESKNIALKTEEAVA